MLRLLTALAAFAQPADGGPVRPPPPPASGTAAPIRGHATITAPPAAERHWVRYEGTTEILFRVTVAGRETWALLDTGSSHSIIDTGLAREAGLAIDAAAGTARTPTGVMEAQLASDVTFIIPNHLHVRLSRAATIDLSHVSAAIGRPIGLILGWEVLGSVALVVDPAERSFYIAQPAEVRIQARTPSITLSRDARLPARIGEHDVSLLLDLGHDGVIGLRPEVWNRVAPPGTETRSGTSRQAEGVARPIRIGRLPEVVIGPAALRDVPTTIRAVAGDADGIVGMGLFRRLSFVLDAPGGRLWFLPAGAAGVVGTPEAKPGSE